MKRATQKLAEYIADNLEESNVKPMARAIYTILRKARDSKSTDGLIDMVEKIRAQAKGGAIINIVSAKKLSDDEQTTLEEAVKKHYPSEDTVIKYDIDESLLRGIRLEVDDQAIDFSAKNKLKRLKNKLSGGI